VATNVTSLVPTESTIPNRRIRTHAGGFAMITIANLRCACSLVLNSPASSPYANLADPVRRHSAEPLKIIPHTQDSFIRRVGRIRDAFGSAGLHRSAGGNQHCFTRRKNKWLPKL
jgi:hypothetical protein